MSDRQGWPPEALIIRTLQPEDIQNIEDIAAAAWAPIYEHFYALQEQALGGVARRSTLDNKRQQVRDFATNHAKWVLVSELAGEVVGFITYTVDRDNRVGTIGNNAVAPGHAGRGIGCAQYERVLQVFRDEGMEYASVTTGLDESHAPARRAYEKAGFVQVLPHVEYMRRL
ncbi:MAG: GNAT family N-acetyltransferase [Anaerolineae bacterium]